MSDNDGKQWIAYVVYVDSERMDKIFFSELAHILMSFRDCYRFSFNFYPDVERPHISIRMSEYSYRFEERLDKLQDSKLIDDWSLQPYDASEKIRTAYEVASKSALRAKELLDKYGVTLDDGEFVDHLVHGFMDAIGFHSHGDEVKAYFSILERLLKSLKQKMEDVLNG